MAQPDPFRSPRKPWNSGRLIGPKPPLKPKHIWAIRQQLKNGRRVRDLALFNCAIVMIGSGRAEAVRALI